MIRRAAVAQRPLGFGWEVLWEIGDHFWAMGEGGLGKRLLLPLRGEPGPLLKHQHPPQPEDLEACLHELTSQELEPTRLRLAVEGQDGLAALYELIDNASARIDVLMFYWESDEVGTAIATRLALKAGPRLRVRVLIDGGGNLVFGLPHHVSAAQANRVLTILTSNPYIEVIRIRNPFMRFDHRKLVLVDGRWVWSGGRNFSHEAFFDNHDLSFVFDGPLVPKLQQRYEAYWRHQHGAPSEPPPVPPTTADPCHGAVPGQARIIVSEPGQRQLARALYLALEQAQQRVYLENVYFSDSRLIVRLAEARRRGVDVRVVLTFASESDTVNRANKVVANRLLRAGVRVYVYPGKTHVKVAAGGRPVGIHRHGQFRCGTSLRHNYEFGLSLGPGPAIAELEQQLFVPDFQPGYELTQPVPLSPQDYLSELLASVFL